jgi:hypothetical protein
MDDMNSGVRASLESRNHDIVDHSRRASALHDQQIIVSKRIGY